MEPENTTPDAASAASPARAKRSRFSLPRVRQRESSGQAIVEFAIVSMAFFMIVFGTIDFGRAIYMYSQLHNAVQEGARFGKSQPYDTEGIRETVMAKASSFDLEEDDITVTCRDKYDVETECWNCAKVQVEADADFSAITQDFLGIGSIDLKAISKVATE